MSRYRYVATNVRTGVILAETVPIHVSTINRTFGGVGQPGKLSGILDLGRIGAGPASTYIDVLEPRRTMLWVLQDEGPIWAGIVVDELHSSAASHQLPVDATEIEWLFNDKREIRTDLTWAAGTDVFTVFRGLISYATGKVGGEVAGLILGSNLSGITLAADTTFPGNNSKVGAVASAFAAQYGFEFDFAPARDDSGNLIIKLLLGYPTITRAASATNLMFRFPGNLADYGWPRSGSGSVNSLIATASADAGVAWTSDATAHGYNADEIAAGYPLLEGSTTYTASTITSQAQIDAVADGQLPAVTGTLTVPTVIVAGGQIPKAGQVQLGDEAKLAATSSRHPARADGSPGLQATVRIIGWTVQPGGDGQAETTTYALGGITT